MVPAPAPDTPEAVDAAVPPATRAARLAEIASGAMAGAGVTTGPFGIVHGFEAGTRLVSHPAGMRQFCTKPGCCWRPGCRLSGTRAVTPGV